ncbi:NADP-dependent isocitrate dehydrogenase [Kamptonema cortianum]|nr:NADP-dependent isocitrate dehydrogenase [Kamptonema cortianum]
MSHTITLIPGDGIGPEVTAAARRIIDASGVKITWEEAHAGASVFKQGIPSGVPKETICSIEKTRLALKGPLETPVGFGEKSANVTLRKLFETYANIRPVKEIPSVPTPFSGRNLNLVVIRENVEDLYAGIEHMQTPDVAQCLKLISRKGSQKVVRLAFEFARAEGRTKVSCATKANIMKFTEGFLKSTFEQIAPEYPDIVAEHIIIDNCAHQLVKKPEQFDVIVTTNMNGDIISDLSSGLIGGLGFAPSANIGSEVAIFEAVHGSAPKYAGKNSANPTALILSGVMMLRHIGELAAAKLIENAVLYTLEEGRTVTRDVVGDAKASGTREFTDAVITHFGKAPSRQGARETRKLVLPVHRPGVKILRDVRRETIGADVFVEFDGAPTELGAKLEAIAAATEFRLKMISNRGTQVYPDKGARTDCVDHWRCRFVREHPLADFSIRDSLGKLLQGIEDHGLRWMHIEKLITLDGKPAYTKAQGED